MKGIDLTARLLAQEEYRTIKTAYNVRFFPEKKRGTEERRPEGLSHGVATEGWEDSMPEELRFFTAMAHRKTQGVLSASRAERRRLTPEFELVRSVEELRALAACIWIEMSGDFPHKGGRKKWTTKDLLKATIAVTQRNKRREAFNESVHRFKNVGLHVENGVFAIDFGRFDLERIRENGVPGLVEHVRIPLFALARLDDHDIASDTDLIKWLSIFLKPLKINKETISSAATELATFGVQVKTNVFRIDPAKLDLDGIASIRIQNTDPLTQGALSFRDIAALHGHSLTDETSLRLWLDSVLRESKHGDLNASKAIRTKKSRGLEDEKVQFRTPRTINTFYGRLNKLRMSDERAYEIESAIEEGRSVMEFYDEILTGFQAYILNIIFRKGQRVHHSKQENIEELFGEANLVVTRRLPNFKVTTTNNDTETGSRRFLLRNYIYRCVMSVISDAPRSGIIDGVRMFQSYDRVVLAHQDIVREALASQLGGDDNSVMLIASNR